MHMFVRLFVSFLLVSIAAPRALGDGASSWQTEQKLWKRFDRLLNAKHKKGFHDAASTWPAKLAEAQEIFHNLTSLHLHRDAAEELRVAVANHMVPLPQFLKSSMATSKLRGFYTMPTWAASKWRLRNSGVGQVPLVTYLVIEYLESREDELRTLLMDVLRWGGNPNAVSPWTVDRAPFVFLMHYRIPTDVELLNALAEAGLSVEGFFTLVPVSEAEHDARCEGMSLLHSIMFDIEHVVFVRRLLRIVDEYCYTADNFPESLPTSMMPDGNLSNAFWWLARTPLATRSSCSESTMGPDQGFRKVKVCRQDRAWQGHPHRVFYQNLRKYSPHFRLFEEKWTRNTWRTEIPRNLSHGISEDIKIASLKALIGSEAITGRKMGLDVAAEISVQLPGSGWNFLHLCALWRTPRVLLTALQAVDIRATSTAYRRLGMNVTNGQVLARALQSTTNALHRTALHIAAVNSFGIAALQGTTCYDIMMDLLANISRVDATWLSAGDPRDMKDDLGFRPMSYYTEAAHVLHSAVPKVARATPSVGQTDHKSTGGWPQMTLHEYLMPEHSRETDRCDITEVSPSTDPTYLRTLLNSGQPWIMRSAPTSLGRVFNLKGFERARFVERYGRSKVKVDTTPYGNQHRSDFSTQMDTEPQFEWNISRAVCACATERCLKIFGRPSCMRCIRRPQQRFLNTFQRSRLVVWMQTLSL